MRVFTGLLAQETFDVGCQEKRKRHRPEQIIAKLREADAMLAGGASVGQVLQALGVSEATLNRWRNQYGGMKSGDAKRARLKVNDPQLCAFAREVRDRWQEAV